MYITYTISIGTQDGNSRSGAGTVNTHNAQGKIKTNLVVLEKLL